MVLNTSIKINIVRLQTLYFEKNTVRNGSLVKWSNGLPRKVDEIKLKHPQYVNYRNLGGQHARGAAEDIALLRVRTI